MRILVVGLEGGGKELGLGLKYILLVLFGLKSMLAGFPFEGKIQLGVEERGAGVVLWRMGWAVRPKMGREVGARVRGVLSGWLTRPLSTGGKEGRSKSRSAWGELVRVMSGSSGSGWSRKAVKKD